ncbi:MAG: HNH endonuclease [Candidatus Saccharibacteria bacterium]|nr:HNH endonuclease [Rhodoferax sp.]
MINCTHCGIAVNKCPSRLLKSRHGDHFCGTACKNAHARPWPVFICKCCGISFARRVSPVLIERVKFCSKACHHTHERVGRINEKGYRVFSLNGRKRLEHRLVASVTIGRALLPGEDVHHIDGNKLNNLPENLQVFDKAAHTRHHNALTFDIEAAKSLIAEGVSVEEVSRRLSVDARCISRALQRRGFTIASLRSQPNGL